VAVCSILAMTFSENRSDKVELKGDNIASFSREEVAPSETEVSLLTVLEPERVDKAGLSSSDSLDEDGVARNMSSDCTGTKHK